MYIFPSTWSELRLNQDFYLNYVKNPYSFEMIANLKLQNGGNLRANNETFIYIWMKGLLYFDGGCGAFIEHRMPLQRADNLWFYTQKIA